ncbi:MAG: hypothetical protein RLP97_15260 [Coleofasciculus chthonoplastes F2-STO-03]
MVKISSGTTTLIAQFLKTVPIVCSRALPKAIARLFEEFERSHKVILQPDSAQQRGFPDRTGSEVSQADLKWVIPPQCIQTVLP